MIVIGSGFYTTYREFQRPSVVRVTRSQLTDLLSVARANAESSDTLAGDLSWLQDDAAMLIAIKAQRPETAITIWYDKAEVDHSFSTVFSRLENAGINLLPYPDGHRPPIRCTIIDRAIPDSVHVFAYLRYRTLAEKASRELNVFEWHSIPRCDVIAASLASAYTSLLRLSATPKIYIGISGINNVGKTTLTNRLKAALELQRSVDVVPDLFRFYGNAIGLHHDLRIVVEQAAKLNSTAEIIIYDRPIIDNFCTMQMRYPDAADICNEIEPLVARTASQLDLIFDIRHPDSEPIRKTTHLTAAQRRRTRELQDSFNQRHGLGVTRIIIDYSTFDACIDEATESILAATEELLQRRKIV